MKTVRDIMNTDLVSVRSGSSVDELIQLLDEHAISGVPVLDATGRIEGVVSRTDVIRSAARAREEPAPDAFWESLAATSDDDVDDAAWFLAPESASLVVPSNRFPALGLGELTVDEIMTPVAFSVDPDMAVTELADFLVRGRIHRALVVDGTTLVGIVTAFDLLQVMAGNAQP